MVKVPELYAYDDVVVLAQSNAGLQRNAGSPTWRSVVLAQSGELSATPRTSVPTPVIGVGTWDRDFQRRCSSAEVVRLGDSELRVWPRFVVTNLSVDGTKVRAMNASYCAQGDELRPDARQRNDAPGKRPHELLSLSAPSGLRVDEARPTHAWGRRFGAMICRRSCARREARLCPRPSDAAARPARQIGSEATSSARTDARGPAPADRQDRNSEGLVRRTSRLRTRRAATR